MTDSDIEELRCPSVRSGRFVSICHERFELFGIISDCLKLLCDKSPRVLTMFKGVCIRLSLALRLKNRGCLLGGGQPFSWERERSDDNDARALFLSNAAEERIEALDIITNRFQFCHQRGWLREVS